MATTKFCLVVILVSMLLMPSFADPWFWSSDKEEKKDQTAGTSSAKADDAKRETGTLGRIESFLGRILSYGKEYPKRRPMPTASSPPPTTTITTKDLITATTTKSMTTAEDTQRAANLTERIKIVVDHTKHTDEKSPLGCLSGKRNDDGSCHMTTDVTKPTERRSGPTVVADSKRLANKTTLHITSDKKLQHIAPDTHHTHNKSDLRVVKNPMTVTNKKTLHISSDKSPVYSHVDKHTKSHESDLTSIASDKKPVSIPVCKDGLMDEQGNCMEASTDKSQVGTKSDKTVIHEMKTMNKTTMKIPVAQTTHQTTMESDLTVAQEMKHVSKTIVGKPEEVHSETAKGSSFISNMTSLKDFLTDEIKSVISCVEGSCSKETSDTATKTMPTTTTTMPTTAPWIHESMTTIATPEEVTNKEITMYTAEPRATTTTKAPMETMKTDVTVATTEPPPASNWITTEAPTTTTTTTTAPMETEFPTTEPLPTPNWITTTTTEAPLTTTIATEPPMTTEAMTIETTVPGTDRPCVPGQGKPCIEIVKTKEPNMEPCTTPSMVGRPCKKRTGWKRRKEYDSDRPKSSYRFNWQDIKIAEFFRRKYDPTYRGRYRNYYQLKYEKKYDPTFRQAYDNYDNYDSRDYEEDYRKQPEESKSLNVIDEKHCKKIFSKEYVAKYMKICLDLFKDYVHEDNNKKCKKLAKNQRKIYYRKCKHTMKKREEHDDSEDHEDSVKEPKNQNTESWDWSTYWRYFLPSKNYGKIAAENAQPFMKKTSKE